MTPLFNADEGTTDEWYVEPFKYNKPLAEAMADVQAAVAQSSAEIIAEWLVWVKKLRRFWGSYRCCI